MLPIGMSFSVFRFDRLRDRSAYLNSLTCALSACPRVRQLTADCIGPSSVWRSCCGVLSLLSQSFVTEIAGKGIYVRVRKRGIIPFIMLSAISDGLPIWFSSFRRRGLTQNRFQYTISLRISIYLLQFQLCKQSESLTFIRIQQRSPMPKMLNT